MIDIITNISHSVSFIYHISLDSRCNKDFLINYTFNETKVQFAQGNQLGICDYTP